MPETGTVRSAELAEEIAQYWDARASSYSAGVIDELEATQRAVWTEVLKENAASVLTRDAALLQKTRTLDLGCGPGFFSVLLACMGCEVCAVDGSPEMLARARENVRVAAPHAHVDFRQADLQALPFADDTFDLAVSRNVTWLMQEPEAAYAEWLRVLRPGGTLLVFDANWYLYLADESIDLARHADQDGKSVEEWSSDAIATPEQERLCEMIAARLPLTPVLRPDWDLEVLPRLGARKVSADTDVWQRLWTEGEKAFYRTSPLFLVKAEKAGPDAR